VYTRILIFFILLDTVPDRSMPKIRSHSKYTKWTLSYAKLTQESNEATPNTQKPTILDLLALLGRTQKKFRQGFPPILALF